MLIHLQTVVVFIGLLSCLASAFSTRFLIEGVDEVGKTPKMEETKMQKMEKNGTVKNEEKAQGIEVEVIPIVTDVFTQSEDLFNMTPLKLVAAISAQHLITTIKHIPIAGNTYKDSLDMLENIVNEFNKTAEIIKLTAKYVNISGHYILSILKEFAEQNCDVKSLDKDMKSVRMNFLKTISDHAIGAIKELNEKTRKREMTGSDILITSSYHIVSAFQEMTQRVLALSGESKKKCEKTLQSFGITAPSKEKNNVSEQNKYNVFSFQPIPQQGKKHKSIKKDQARQNIGETKNDKLQDRIIENFNNQDLTIEFFSPEAFSTAENTQSLNQNHGKNQLRVPEDLNVKYIPLSKIFSQKTVKNGLQSDTTKEHISQNIQTSNNFDQNQGFDNFNNQDLTVEVFSPETVLNIKTPLFKNQKSGINGLRDMKIENIPLNKLSLLGSNNGILTDTLKEYNNQRPQKINKVELFTEQIPNNDKNPQFKVDVFTPETIKKSTDTNRKIEENKLKVPKDMKIDFESPKKISVIQNSKNGVLFETSKENNAMQKPSKNIDRELDLSAVDSLSNVPWQSSEVQTNIKKTPPIQSITEKALPPKIETNIFDLFSSPHQNENVKQTQCDGHLEPVCGFDEKTNKFLLFLNDCKREAYNRFYETNYSPAKMDSCVSLFHVGSILEANSPDFLHKTVDFRPR